MLDDIPDLSDGTIDWPDDWTERERVRAIADTITQPRTTEEIAELAGADEDQAARVLAERIEQDPHLRRDGDEYRRTDL